jgi:heme exporter protein A
MTAPTIAARALGKSFGFTTVLREVNLTVEAGAGLVVYGRNGSGKSTLVNLLAGLNAPTSGAALLFGSPSAELDPLYRRRVGLLSHQSFLYPNLSARENLGFFCNLYRIKPAAPIVQRWIDRVGLAAMADQRVSGFSRGMQQRLSLARAMLPEPDALVIDEPFASLDPEGTEVAVGILREAMARGCAILMTAHVSTPAEGLSLPAREILRGRLVEPSTARIARQAPMVASRGR